LLVDCVFKIREAGRQRVLQTGHRNVHAFVIGTVTASAYGIDKTGKQLPIRITYNPNNDQQFMALDGKSWPWPVKSARAVLLNEHGMTACYVEA
jgi:hypothetical protein